VIYNETCIDISLINHKFHHQNKKTTVYHLLVCSFSLASITDVMSIFRRQKRFVPLFLLAAAKSALSILTVKYRVLLTSLSSAIRNLTAPCSSQYSFPHHVVGLIWHGVINKSIIRLFMQQSCHSFIFYETCNWHNDVCKLHSAKLIIYLYKYKLFKRLAC